ncbi:probable RNA-directed DNA polymerase from transposon X-element [Trichonephila clavipes]|nr:probable RNA-directed DNA polymerase from transposon X-element [Trichonephila clavipes]
MLRITTTFREQMKTLKELMPKLRSKKTREYIKLYTDNADEKHELENHLERLKYEFYSITPKEERPIKVVIKGLPKDTKTSDIHSDLVDLGFTVNRVTQLINSNCVIFGDFNATHNYWNCSNNSPRGVHLKNFIDNTNLQIAFPNSPTRYGYNSANTLDFALINNFNFPFFIESIPELSSDHNPVMLNFSLTLSIHKANPRAISTCWSAFKKNITESLHLPNYKNITNPLSLEDKITDAVSSAHTLASKPIVNKHHHYTSQHIKDLIRQKNRARKPFQRTLNPLHKTEANRLPAIVKKELIIHTQNTWNTKYASLNTQDNSLWHTQKCFRKNRLTIPNLNYSCGIASKDDQKANLIANTFEDNYTENKIPENFSTNIDSDFTNTLENFLSIPPHTPILPTDPVEMCSYIKRLKNSKAPGFDSITNKSIKNFPIIIIQLLTYLINKILLLRHFPRNRKLRALLEYFEIDPKSTRNLLPSCPHPENTF